MRRLEPHEYPTLFETLGDMPITTIPLHQLRYDLADATLIGEPDHIQGLVIQNRGYPDEPTGFGSDPEAIWTILQDLAGWMCIEVSREIAPELQRLMQGRFESVRWYEDIHYVLDQPVADHGTQHAVSLPGVTTRLLTVDDLPMLRDSPPELQPTGFGSLEADLRDGIAAGSIVDRQLVAIAHVSAVSPRYADVGVYTHDDWRKRGLSTHAAALVMAEVQARGLTPIWSTGEDNLASQRVAVKLGVREVEGAIYLIPQITA